MFIRPVVKIHGGKRYLYKWIIDHFPADYVEMKYVEACGGAASVLLNKIRSKEEIYNDLDSGIYNLFYCLKTSPNSFMEMVEQIPYSREVFEQARYAEQNKFTGSALELAIRTLIIRRMSRGGLGTHFSWSERKRGGLPGEVNSWQTFKSVHLPAICERVKDVKFYNEHVVDLIHKLDAPDVLWYIDPPYLPSTRAMQFAYNVEMTEGEHIMLAQALKDAKSKVVLSGYFSPLYAKLYKQWKMVAKEMANHSAQSKKKERRIECIWMNY